MNFAQLFEHARAGRVRELSLLSLEGGIYLLEAGLEEGTRLLRDSRGEAIRLRSAEHARELLKDLPVLPFFLVHSLAHDELCGMPMHERSVMRIPIAFRSGWA